MATWKDRFGSMPAYLLVAAVTTLVATRLSPVRESVAQAQVAELIQVGEGLRGSEENAGVVMRNVGGHETLSAHFVRLKDRMPAHMHRSHDETVVALSGEGIVTLDGVEKSVRPGTLILIPRGTVHSARAVGGPIEVVSFFSPPFDGKDRHVVD